MINNSPKDLAMQERKNMSVRLAESFESFLPAPLACLFSLLSLSRTISFGRQTVILALLRSADIPIAAALYAVMSGDPQESWAALGRFYSGLF